MDYLGNANYSGVDALTISVDDQGNTGSGGAKTDSRSVAITVAAVNDAPVLTVPGAKSVDEDTLLSITGISVADVDAATGAVKITMSVAQRTLTLAQTTGLTFTTGDGTSDASMVFTGTVANVNSALARDQLPGQRQLQRQRYADDQRRRPGQYGLGRRQDGQ